MGIVQGSEEWKCLRLGVATASCFSHILAKGAGKVREAYKHRIVSERLTGKPLESYVNPHMVRGTEQEAYARMEYEAETGNIVYEVGFLLHPELRAGASPDGLIDDDGGLEIKSVIPTVQVETIERGGYPVKHKPQIQGGMWVTGRAWWDFCSYSPDMPERLRLYIFRVERDEEYIANLEVEVRKFLNEVDELEQQMRAKNGI